MGKFLVESVQTGKVLPYRLIPFSAIRKNSGGDCWLCGTVVTNREATRDHVIPRSHGGPDKLENLRLTHGKCNNNRGDEVLISEEEKRIIVVAGQKGQCSFCRKQVTAIRSKIVTVAEYDYRNIRPVLVAVCLTGCKMLAKIPTQDKTTGVDMGSEMIIADTLSPMQVEVQDYVRFTIGGVTHEGVVLNVEDNGDTFTITLSDDIEGDAIEYVVGADSDVQLMMYGAVAV